MYVCMSVHNINHYYIYIHMYIYTYTFIHSYLHSCIHTFIHQCIHTLIHSYIFYTACARTRACADGTGELAVVPLVDGRNLGSAHFVPH